MSRMERGLIFRNHAKDLPKTIDHEVIEVVMTDVRENVFTAAAQGLHLIRLNRYDQALGRMERRCPLVLVEASLGRASSRGRRL